MIGVDTSVIGRLITCPSSLYLYMGDSMHKKFTNEDIDRKLMESNKNFRRIGNYINFNYKIEWQCTRINDGKFCGFIWKARAINILRTNARFCPECLKTELRKRFQHSIPFIIEKFKNIYGDLYDYSHIKEYDNALSKLPIYCKKHETIFYKTYDNHLKQGCPICKESIGHHKTRKFLSDYNLKFIPEISFPDCKYKKRLRFDFGIYDNEDNLIYLIEYQGQQHYKPARYLGGKIFSREESAEKLKLTKTRDKIKKDYCKQNGIELIIISYKKINQIEEFLKIKLKIK